MTCDRDVAKYLGKSDKQNGQSTRLVGAFGSYPSDQNSIFCFFALCLAGSGGQKIVALQEQLFVAPEMLWYVVEVRMIRNNLHIKHFV